MMSILHVVQSHSHSIILSINYRLQIIELIKTTEFELKHGFNIGFFKCGTMVYNIPYILNSSG